MKNGKTPEKQIADKAELSLTGHGLSRMRERLGADSEEECVSLAYRAWRNGKTPDMFKGRMRKCLDKKLRLSGAFSIS